MDISARPPGTARRCRRTSRPPRSPWRGRGRWRCWTRSATRGRGVRSSGDAPESLREVTLAAAENRIADLWPLAGLGRLHRLDLAGNAVADVSALGDVSGLVWLRLLGNPDSHALPLGRLAQLRWLWLDAGPAPPR